MQAVLLKSKDVTFRVSVYGYLESVKPNDPKQEALNRLNQIIGRSVASSHSFPFTLNPNNYRAAAPACPSVSGNGGKVRQIGGITFSYYPSSHFSGNGGKLQRVGDIVITYYPQNSFEGKGDN